MGRRSYAGRRARAFIFDLDGTLVDSVDDIAVSANVARRHFDLPELPLDEVRVFIGDGVVRLLERSLARDGAPADPDRVREGLAVFRDHYGRHCLDRTRLYPGVLETLRHFARIPMAVATNKPRVFTDRILSGLHVAGAFARVVAGDEIEGRKHDPAHLRACLEGLDVDPAEVAVVGDHANDVHAARALGAIAVGAAYGIGPLGMMRAAGPDLLIDRFDALREHFPSRDTL